MKGGARQSQDASVSPDLIFASFYLSSVQKKSNWHRVVAFNLFLTCLLSSHWVQTLGVSQCRGRLLGSTCLPSHLLQKRGKNPS